LQRADRSEHRFDRHTYNRITETRVRCGPPQALRARIGDIAWPFAASSGRSLQEA
jgi:hypothetical protein